MGNYDDIINLPHYRPKNHPHMPVADRAAQFAPFAALTGYDDAIGEAARLTDRRIELDENQLAELNFKLTELSASISEKPQITVTYFVPDKLKEGGRYVTITAGLKKADMQKGLLFFTDGTVIATREVFAIIY